MQASYKSEPSTFRKILLNSLLAAIIGGIITFFFMSASPENALKIGSRSGNSLSGGFGLIGFFGAILWNIFISIFGAMLSGFAVAIGSLVYYSVSRRGKVS